MTSTASMTSMASLTSKMTKIASNLDTEWFSWPQSSWQPLFVGLIFKKPFFLWYLAPSLLEAVEASLWHLYEIWGSKVKCGHCSWTCLWRKINKIIDPSTPQNHLQLPISMWDTLYSAVTEKSIYYNFIQVLIECPLMMSDILGIFRNATLFSQFTEPFYLCSKYTHFLTVNINFCQIL